MKKGRNSGAMISQTQNHLRRYHQRWTESEDNKLRELWKSGKNRAEIAQVLSRTPLSITIRARRFGLLRKRRPFLPQEVNYVKKHYKTMPVKELARHINHSPTSVRGLMRREGLRKHRLWTEEEEHYFRTMYGKISAKAIAKHLNRPVEVLYTRAHKLGIAKQQDYKRWTPEEREFFRKNFMTMSFTELAKHFKRSYWAIGQQAFRLGLRKRESLRKQNAR
jgi:hypothetical protein